MSADLDSAPRICQVKGLGFNSCVPCQGQAYLSLQFWTVASHNHFQRSQILLSIIRNGKSFLAGERLGKLGSYHYIILEQLPSPKANSPTHYCLVYYQRVTSLKEPQKHVTPVQKTSGTTNPTAHTLSRHRNILLYLLKILILRQVTLEVMSSQPAILFCS